MGFRVIDVHGGLKTSYLAQASEVTITTTGNIDNLDFSNAATIRMNNASLSTLRGLKAGVAGQRVVIVSVGAGEVDLAHQNANSTAANRLINLVTSGITPLAAGTGVATYEYDGTTARWRLIAHDQGAYIVPTFSSGRFSASGSMTWPVVGGSITAEAFKIQGRNIFLDLIVSNVVLGGVADKQLKYTLPNGYTSGSNYAIQGYTAYDNSVPGYARMDLATSSATIIMSKDFATTNNWTLANSSVIAVVMFELV